MKCNAPLTESPDRVNDLAKEYQVISAFVAYVRDEQTLGGAVSQIQWIDIETSRLHEIIERTILTLIARGGIFPSSRPKLVISKGNELLRHLNLPEFS